MWREVLFPNVVPDTTWGAMGYWVIDENRKTDWARLRHKDPTLVGAGYTSAIITGSHPNGGLAIDDINNDKNSESDRENERVNRVLTETVYPGIEDPDVWHTFAQTPWTTRDALSVAKATGVYQWCRTPVLTPCSEDEPGAVWVEVKNDVRQVVYGVWARLTWPEKFGVREIRKCYKTSLRRGFARMYLLDLSQAEGVNLRREWLHSFPAEKLNESWPVYMGIDYASSAGDLRYRDRDYCSISIGKAMPTGGVVLVDGFRDRLPRAEAVLKVRAIAGMYPTLVSIGVEAEGTGIEFYNDLALTTTLPVLPMRTKGRSKGTRFEDIMAPRFEMSQAWISDVRTPFVTKFIDEWCGWPDSDHDDTLDSTYYMLAVSGMFLKDLEQSDDIPDPWWQPKKKRLDWSGMRERSG
jgi:phage terminase large subunit-like protein